MNTALITRHRKFIFLFAVCAAALLVSFTASAEGLLLSPDEYLAIKEQCRLVDVRSAEAFLAERLPDSIWLAASEFSKESGTSAEKMPDEDDLLLMLSDRGFGQDMHIVLYGANGSAGDIIAVTRVFWALEFLGYAKVSILDGGMSRWKEEGKPVVTEAPTSALSPAAIHPAPEAAGKGADLAAVKQAQETNCAVLVDARPPNQYTGSVQVKGMSRKGHIPGAHNIPYFLTMNMPHAVFKSLDDLKATLYTNAITPESAIITYCNTGASSTVLYFAYRLIGHGNIANYDGGMFEWTANAELTVSTDQPGSN